MALQIAVPIGLERLSITDKLAWWASQFDNQTGSIQLVATLEEAANEIKLLKFMLENNVHI